MKSKIALIFCIGTLAIAVAGCADNTDKTEKQTETVEETATIIPSDTDSEWEEEHLGLSKSRFCEMATAYYNLSEKEAEAMYQKIEDSKILEKDDMRLTGAVLNDYDGSGQTDMLVCLYEDKEDADSYTDGCLYLFMNDDEPYYIYDDFCCYLHGWIFGDFGADVDHDGNTEIVFCVQGTGCGGAGDCQKFVIKYKDNEIERMELPDDFPSDYDYDIGLSVDVERDNENNVYKVYCPYLDETVSVSFAEDEEDWGGGSNCRGYYILEMTEYEGGKFLTGYEYLYAGGISSGIGNAVFLFDWDENGKVFVKDWYVEDWDEKKYVPSNRIQKTEPDASQTIFDKNETSEEAAAYEEFLTGKRAAGIAKNVYTDTSYRGLFVEDTQNTDTQENGLFLNDLLVKILNETREDRGMDDADIGSVQYALIDCGGDGKKQLALRAYGLGIYAPDDDSDLTMVFDYKDGKVSMIYAVDSWARSDNELYQNGYVSGYGSGGAACPYVWEGVIGADGIYRKSYNCGMKIGSSLYGMSSCWTVWDDSKVFPVDFYEYTINDDTIYAYDIWDEVTDAEKKIIMDYINDNEARMATRFLTDDEAWARVEKNRKRLNITDEMGAEENKINWRTLSSELPVLQR